jgi:hypothetical protein
MKNLKTYEGFSMRRDFCDRCGEPTNNRTTLSLFNTDVICIPCKEEEKKDPEYGAAIIAEREAVMRGEREYQGAMPNYKPLKVTSNSKG